MIHQLQRLERIGDERLDAVDVGMRKDRELEVAQAAQTLEELQPEWIPAGGLVPGVLAVQRLHHVADGELVGVDDFAGEGPQREFLAVPASLTAAAIHVAMNAEDAELKHAALRARLERAVDKIANRELARHGVGKGTWEF